MRGPAALLGLLALTARAHAQAAGSAASRPVDCPTDSPPPTRWAAPLDRVVTPGPAATAIPLRTALERLAAAARVRLSYSREFLPLDRAACLDPAPATLGNALARLLHGTGVQPVGVGDDQVVLAPATSGAAAPTAPSAVAVLERVVVTGSAAGAPTRRLPFALDVVDGVALGASGTATSATASIAASLDGRIPGLWLWAQPPTAVLTRYASLRGASSFGASAPKLFLDGVEVANPLVVTDLPAERVARVEVIRGPQGAALYGADAISGVINIVTRTDGADEGTARTVSVRGGVGAAGGSDGNRPALAQDYAVFLRAGAGPRTSSASLGVSTLGPYVPGAVTRRFTGMGSLRRITSAGTLSATARLAVAATSTPPNPELRAALLQIGDTILPDQRLQHLTLGATATRATGGRWTHTLTAGVDGYRLRGVTSGLLPLPAQLDTAQRSARGGAVRGTLRATSTTTVTLTRRVSVTVTGIADYGLLGDATEEGASVREKPPYDVPDGGTRGGVRSGYQSVAVAPGDTADRPTVWLGSAGLVGQTTLAFADALFVTAGLRGERNDGFTRASRFAALPSLGVALVRQTPAGAAGRATVKLRGAYGSGLRPARTATRATSWPGAGRRGPSFLSADFAPESQRGFEGGVDLHLDGAGTNTPSLGLHATRFDQRADNLLQQVTVGPPSGWTRPAADSMTKRAPPFRHLIENVGQITNRGWEFAGDLRAGPLTLGTTLALVDSRVRRLAPGYTGDLRAGDRTLEVPERTLGANAVWRRGGWTAALGAARASNWINYDRLALTAAVVARGRAQPEAFVGDSLRAYWRRYPGLTRLNASASRDVAPGLTLVLTGDNLLDRQQGEPDNATVLPGRTVTVGVRARF